jgi:hypothetical protein
MAVIVDSTNYVPRFDLFINLKLSLHYYNIYRQEGTTTVVVRTLMTASNKHTTDKILVRSLSKSSSRN